MSTESRWKQFAQCLPGYMWALSYNRDFEKDSKSAFQFLLEPRIAGPEENDYPKLTSTSMTTDGTKVVGYFKDDKTGLWQAFLWMPGGMFQPLERWEKPYHTNAVQISADGTKIIGEAFGSGSIKPKFVFWDKDKKIHLIDAFNEGYGHRPIAWDANLNRIITYSLEPDAIGPIDYDDDNIRVKYTLWNFDDEFKIKSFKAIPFEFENEETTFRVTAMSADGRTVVGYKMIEEGEERAIMWKLDNNGSLGEHEELLIANHLEEETDRALSVNANGTIIGGYTYHYVEGFGDLKKSVIWEQGNTSFTAQPLFASAPQHQDKDENLITLFNAKGDVIIGQIGTFNFSFTTNYMWTQNTGIVYVSDIFKSKLPTEQTRLDIKAISADGTILTGKESYHNNALVAYIPHFPTFEQEGLPLNFLGDYKNHRLNKKAYISMSDDMDVEINNQDLPHNPMALNRPEDNFQNFLNAEINELPDMPASPSYMDNYFYDYTPTLNQDIYSEILREDNQEEPEMEFWGN